MNYETTQKLKDIETDVIDSEESEDYDEYEEGNLDFSQNSKPDEIKPSSSSNDDDNNLKKRLIKLMIIIGGGMIVLLLILFLISTVFTKKYTYEDVEEEMMKAAESYFEENSKKLPQDEFETVEIKVDTLIAAEKMKSLDKYLGENNGCSGKVQVKKSDDTYVYTPYLTCKDKYTTQFLADAIAKEENLVGSGYGLYLMNDAYVFRGENVNNFVQLEAKLWRVVKVNSDKTIILNIHMMIDIIKKLTMIMV